MSGKIRTSIFREIDTKKKNFGLQLKKYKHLTSAYIANAKTLKLAIASISPEEFEESTNWKLKQLDGDHCSNIELMKLEIESRLIHLNNAQSIELWELAKAEGIIPAIKKLYHKRNIKIIL